ncbi:PspC domain-containing protein [Balneolaceae bacterium ANBcel3]|nr:PspC domain-containing protein [Balneolaceae bacterium ANBcel3]
MTYQKVKNHHLKNNLCSRPISDEEFNSIGERYRDSGHDTSTRSSMARVAKYMGVGFLAIVALYLIQQFILPVGPDISSILRLIPSAGSIVVAIIAIILLITYKNKSRTSSFEFSEPVQTDTEDADTEFKIPPGAEPYAYQNKKKWYRSRTNRFLFGVCGGLAERFHIDPTIVRALFALAFLSYGFSLILYIILAIILPAKDLEPLY